jgi:hypothetical protein
MAVSGISLAMKHFGKLPVQPRWARDEGRTGAQGIKDFKDDFDRLNEQDRDQVTEGLSNGSLTY